MSHDVVRTPTILLARLHWLVGLILRISSDPLIGLCKTLELLRSRSTRGTKRAEQQQQIGDIDSAVVINIALHQRNPCDASKHPE